MVIFDLECAQAHRFEGWFTSAGDCAAQLTDGRLECPLCGSHDVRKLPTASHVRNGAPQPAKPPSPPDPGAALRAWLREHTEDVGDRFAEEARRRHYEETDAGAIRGTADAREVEALREEGIDVLQVPESLFEPQH